MELARKHGGAARPILLFAFAPVLVLASLVAIAAAPARTDAIEECLDLARTLGFTEVFAWCLEATAAFLAETGQPRTAARLTGASDAQAVWKGR